MRKFLFSSLFVLLSVVLIVILRTSLPKYSGMLIFFFIFLVADGWLWLSVRGTISRFRAGLRAVLTILFWLPAVLLLGNLVFGLLVPFTGWDVPLRTYVQSMIVVMFLAELFPAIMLILADLLRLVYFALLFILTGGRRNLSSIPRFRPLLAAGWTMGFLIFTIMIAGIIFWQFDFRVRRQVITLKELPAAFDGLKIVQFSDVHLGSWGSKRQLRRAMDEINGLHPDLIFFTGDMFNYCTADGNGFEGILKTLRAPGGIYSILGNHDYGDYITWPSAMAKKQNMADLKKFYQVLGWKLLLNSHDIMRRGSDSIAIIGVENWGATNRFQKLGDVAKAQQGTENMGVQLLLSHDPSYWDRIVSRRYPNIDVTFSGHTHGGQFGIDCCGIHWSPIEWISRLWCGLYTNPAPGTDQYLYVNQGLGNIGYSGRVGILPEITVIILKAGKGGKPEISEGL